jgi:hypothetical protein
MTTVEHIAQVCHEANRAYCRTLGDVSQPSWEDAPAWQRESAISGVLGTLANPTMTPEQRHEQWWAEKRAAGWTYGEVKDAEKKEHPCCVPFAQLSEAQRRKDALFGAIVRTLGFNEAI